MRHLIAKVPNEPTDANRPAKRSWARRLLMPVPVHPVRRARLGLAELEPRSLMTSTPLFNPPTAFSWGGNFPKRYAPALGDFNGDGHMDLAVGEVISRLDTSGGIRVALGNGDGSFQSPTRYLVASSFPASGGAAIVPAVADVNGDGIDDLLVTYRQDGIVRPFLGNTSGTLTQLPNVVIGSIGQQVAVADFDSDGNLDFAIDLSNFSGGRVKLMKGNGAGGFTLMTEVVGPSGYTIIESIAAADFDGDGRADIGWKQRIGGGIPDNLTIALSAENFGVLHHRTAPASGAAVAGILAGTGRAGWVSAYVGGYLAIPDPINSATASAYATVGLPGEQQIVDLNRDGTNDYVYVLQNTSGPTAGAQFALGNGDGTFGTSTSIDSEFGSFDVGDLNGDGYVDLVSVTDSGGRVKVYLQEAPSLVVTTLAEEDDGSALPSLGLGVSLREAVNYANTLGGAPTVSFAASLTANGATVTFSLDSPLNISSSADVTVAFTNASGGVTLSGRGLNRVFTVGAGGRLALRNLTVADGKTTGSGNPGAAIHGGAGAVIDLSGCTFTGNDSGDSDGAAVFVDNLGSVTARNSTFTANTGPGVLRVPNGTLVLENTTVAGNAGRFNVGGLDVSGMTSTFNNNIIANNTGGPDVTFAGSGSLTGSNNLIRSGNAGGLTNTITGLDPLLGALASNGGPTRTMAIGSASPAFNAGTTLVAVAADQRGVARPVHGTYDVGAYEYSGTLPPVASVVVTTAADENDGPTSGTGCSLREALEVARLAPGPTEIVFDPGVFSTRRTITLAAGLGTLVLTDAGGVTVTAPAAGLVLDAGGQFTAVANAGGSVATFDGLTVRGGAATYDGNTGGAFYNGGTLALTGCLLTANSGTFGSAIYSTGTLTVTNTTVTGSTNGGTSRSAIQVAGGTASLAYVTVAGNAADTLLGTLLVNAGAATLTNSVVAGHATGDLQVFSGASLTGSNNRIGAGGTGALTATTVGSPNLSTLGDYGGRTQTMRPNSGSPLIDAGVAVSGISADARGIARPQGSAPDVGAVEARLPGTVSLGVTSLTAYTTGASVNLASALNPSPTGGVFSGEGVANGAFNPAGLTPGAKTITYTVTSADGITASATATINLQAPATTTAVASSSPTSTYGDSVTFTATVSAPSGAGTPAGTVAFIVNGTFVASGVALVNGTATYVTSSLAATSGTPHSITVAYSPTGGYTASTGTLASGQVVNRRTLTVAGLAVVTRPYDGTTAATLDFANAQLQNVVAGDAGAVALATTGYTATFNNASVGANKPVTVTGLGLTGMAAANYTLTQPTGLTGTVTEALSLVVSTENDVVDPLDERTSLREAMRYAEERPGADTITFAPALAGQTVTLSQGWQGAGGATALDVFGGSLTVRGPAIGAGVTLAVAAAADRRHFYVHDGASLTLENLTLRGGRATRAAEPYGGAVWSLGSLTVRGCTFTDNQAGEGGAIQSWGGSPLLRVENSTFAVNSATAGGSALSVGALDATLDHVTAVDNTAGWANGTFLIYQTTVTMRNSVVARNTNDGAGANGNGTGTFSATSADNVVGTGTWPGLGASNTLGVSGTALRFGTLAANGGPTPTVRPQTGSPALDRVPASGLAADQRGIARPQGAAADAGAVEARLPGAVSLGVTSLTVFVNDPPVDLAAATNPDPAGGTFSGEGVSNGVFNPAGLTPGPKTITYTVTSVDGIAASATLTVNVLSATTTTSVASSSPTSTYGDDVTFTATVAGPTGGGTPTGTVTFVIDGTTVASSVALSGSGDEATATYTTASLAATNGTPHVVEVTYTPAGGFGASSGSLAGGQAVDRRTLTVTGITVITRTFDGTTAATLNFAAAQLDNVVAGDAGNVAADPSGYTATFDTAAVGADKPVTVTGLGLTGSAAANYTLAQPAGLTGTITEAPSLVVSTTEDVVDPLDDRTSLREAVQYAEQHAGPDTITFAPALAGQTVILSHGWNGSGNGSSLEVTGGSLTVRGPATGAGVTLSVEVGTNRRHFYVNDTGDLTLENLTLSAGWALDVDYDYGGSVWNFGSLTVRNCTFTDNHAGNEGGAIHSWGSSTLLVVENSTFSGNTSNNVAGAIDSGAATTTFRHITVTNNVAFNGHAIVLYQTQATMVNSIVAGNTDDGIGSANGGGFAAGSTNNILGAGGTGGLVDGVDGNRTGVTATALKLGPLAGNGGPTQTHAPLAGSPAINAAAAGGTTADQRGVARPQYGLPDVGAVEFDAAVESLVVTTIADEDDFTSDPAFGSGTSLREAVRYARERPGADTITFAANLAGQAVTLSRGWSQISSYEATSALVVTGDLTVRGPAGGPGVTLTVDAAVERRHFLVDIGAGLTLENLTLTGGRALVTDFNYGGSVWSFGSLTVRGCTFTGNRAGHEGGAIQSWGGSPLLAVENSTFAGNSSDNLASAVGTGALSSTLDHVTIVDNVAGSSNGTLWVYQTSLALRNTIVARNANDGATTGGGNGSGSLTGVNNLLGAGTWSGLVDGVNGNRLGATAAQLNAGTLADNGGPTPTVALLPGSLALNVATNPTNLPFDQRGDGFLRVFGPAADIGAFERQSAPPAPQVTDVAVNAGQTDTDQRSRVTSITVRFDAEVAFAGLVADAFTLSRIGGDAVGGFTATANVVGGVTVVTLSGFTGAETEYGSLADGRYAVAVRADRVSVDGVRLDGDGDGTGGDDFALDGTVANGLYRLFGDADGDGVVNAFDYGRFVAAYGSVAGQSAYRDWLDIDGDGAINAFDYGRFVRRFGGSVP